MAALPVSERATVFEVGGDAGCPELWSPSEKDAAMANHASMRTTPLYDRRRNEVSLDEVERIAI
jgi:hypothetical protein